MGEIWHNGTKQDSDVLEEALPKIKEEDRERGILRSVQHDDCNFYCNGRTHAMAVSTNRKLTIENAQAELDLYCDVDVLGIRSSEQPMHYVIIYKNRNSNIG